MKILYVEDNEDNIYMLERRLKRAGYDVLIARDGAQGVAMAAAELPELILMDMGLPVLDGSEATRQIKAAPETKHIPVIALTANAMTGDKEKALAAGCDDFDTKPVELPRLLGKIQALARASLGAQRRGVSRKRGGRLHRSAPLHRLHRQLRARGSDGGARRVSPGDGAADHRQRRCRPSVNSTRCSTRKSRLPGGVCCNRESNS